MKTINYIALLILIVSTLQAAGQEQMTLLRAREMALMKNESLKIAGKQLEKSEAQKAAVKTMRLPSFSATGTGIYQNKDFEMELTLPTKTPNLATGELDPNILVDPSTGTPVIGPDGNPVFNMYAWLPLNVSLSGAYLAGVALEQPVYTGGKINAGNRMASIGIEMADENIELERMKTIAEADNAYWTYISVFQKVKVAQQAVDLLDELVKKATDAHDVGMSSRNDLLKAQVGYNNAKLNLQKAQNGLELSRMVLCRVTGLPFNTAITALDTTVMVNAPVELVLEDETIKQRPEYKLLQKNIALQEQNILMTKSDFLPTAGIQAGYNHLGGVKFSDTEFTNTSLNVLASVKIPIFHWGEGVKKINAAKIDKEIKELELGKNEQLMKLEAEQAKLNLQLAWERIRMNETALEQAEENLRVARDNYEVGMETITDLLMAQTNWQQASGELIDSRADFKLKETAWLKATGKLGISER
ncbi:Outer membrane protein TolC [Mariniphaga anaerophila]|uniref:Outer membrane protein TolC n=1 Tax=Mariniphaga anaerophila TaxID=1484053 RepID=A0A1M4YI56_9BACT|nr:TolC family protein [Mariniphaga anaerophila]SHF05136.1 Outer membrane protein TolC [Mariniphaga anaerophila]